MLELIAESGVGRDAAAEQDGAGVVLLGGKDGFFDEHVYNSGLETGGDVGFLLFGHVRYAVGTEHVLAAAAIEDGGFETAEREIQGAFLEIRSREGNGFGVALSS